MKNEFVLANDDRNAEREIKYWESQQGAFRYQPSNPRAPRGSGEEAGWGIPNYRLPPMDAYEFVYRAFQRHWAEVSSDVQLHPRYEYYLYSMVCAHFLWFTDVDGDGPDWVLNMYGVQEVAPFTDAYAYYYINQHGDEISIDSDSVKTMQIFETCIRKNPVPIETSEGGPVLDEMRGLLTKLRDPYAAHRIEHTPPNIARFVSKALRKWFNMALPDKRSPRPDASRIAGRQWAIQIKGPNKQPLFRAIHEVAAHKTRAYRLEVIDHRTRAVGELWCGPSNIRVERLVELRLRNGMTEEDARHTYTCTSCRKLRACVPTTKRERMCCRCRGEIFESSLSPKDPAYRVSASSDHDMLDLCTMQECSKCPSFIESEHHLAELKNRIRRDPTYPVRRSA